MNGSTIGCVRDSAWKNALVDQRRLNIVVQTLAKLRKPRRGLVVELLAQPVRCMRGSDRLGLRHLFLGSAARNVGDDLPPLLVANRLDCGACVGTGCNCSKMNPASVDPNLLRRIQGGC